MIRGYLLLVLMINSLALASNIEVLSGVDKTSVQVGEKITLTVMVIGDVDAPVFNRPTLQNADYMGKPIKQQTHEWVGKRHQSLWLYQCYFKALTPGSAHVDKVKMMVAGKSYHCPAISIVATTKHKGNKLQRAVYILTHCQKYHLYVKQPTTMVSDIFLKANLNFRKSRYHPPSGEGFRILYSERREKGFCVQRGMIYRRIQHRHLLVPVRRGKLSIPGTKYSATLLVAGKKSQFDEVFGKDRDFDIDLFRENPLSEAFGAKKQTLKYSSRSLQLDVKSLPVAERNDNFNGAIGDLQLYTTSSLARSYRNTPVQLLLTIRGIGNLDSIRLAKPTDTSQFSFRNLRVARSQYLDVYGKMVKTFQVELIPLKQGIMKTPNLEWCFFSPRRHKYFTVFFPRRSLRVIPFVATEKSDKK